MHGVSAAEDFSGIFYVDETNTNDEPMSLWIR